MATAGRTPKPVACVGHSAFTLFLCLTRRSSGTMNWTVLSRVICLQQRAEPRVRPSCNSLHAEVRALPMPGCEGALVEVCLCVGARHAASQCPAHYVPQVKHEHKPWTARGACRMSRSPQENNEMIRSRATGAAGLCAVRTACCRKRRIAQGLGSRNAALPRCKRISEERK
jgi:hypothetical protein